MKTAATIFFESNIALCCAVRHVHEGKHAKETTDAVVINETTGQLYLLRPEAFQRGYGTSRPRASFLDLFEPLSTKGIFNEHVDVTQPPQWLQYRPGRVPMIRIGKTHALLFEKFRQPNHVEDEEDDEEEEDKDGVQEIAPASGVRFISTAFARGWKWLHCQTPREQHHETSQPSLSSARALPPPRVRMLQALSSLFGFMTGHAQSAIHRLLVSDERVSDQLRHVEEDQALLFAATVKEWVTRVTTDRQRFSSTAENQIRKLLSHPSAFLWRAYHRWFSSSSSTTTSSSVSPIDEPQRCVFQPVVLSAPSGFSDGWKAMGPVEFCLLPSGQTTVCASVHSWIATVALPILQFEGRNVSPYVIRDGFVWLNILAWITGLRLTGPTASHLVCFASDCPSRPVPNRESTAAAPLLSLVDNPKQAFGGSGSGNPVGLIGEERIERELSVQFIAATLIQTYVPPEFSFTDDEVRHMSDDCE